MDTGVDNENDGNDGDDYEQTISMEEKQVDVPIPNTD